ncbi:hypothetical protein Y032_0145g2493 [Ancylostoma ceylanicum]|uniref:Peptidase A2 domain-containing protein n=1 Tax=Ancylostoma ceylanicum TaxID=53326 RepID=A0A016T1Q2_9BILA|nr:hypothetical protein Y032_0145g2493 [Ancylostoma ceylanicum]
MTEMQGIVKESQLHASTAEADYLIGILTAKLDESEKIRENMKIRLEYPKPKAQKVGAPTKNDPEIVRSSVEIAEQERQYVSLLSVSQTSLSSQNRVDPVALLEKEIATKANVANGSLQKNNGEVMQSKQQHANYRHNYGKGCIFCHKGNHSPIRCRTVSDKRMRRKALKAQNRCWKCFSQTHNSFVCRKQDCSSCGQKHHSSLCSKKEPQQVNYGKERWAITALNKPNSRDWRNGGQNRNSNQPIRMKPTPVAMQMCAENVPDLNHSPLKSTNKQTVLMTADGSIWNAKKQRFEKVLFLFDSGAQKTVIEEKLAEQFGLAKVKTQMCTVSGNGGHVETFESHTVSLKIGTAFGEEIEITGQTRPVITNGFPSVRLGQNDAAFLKANEIYLANTRIRGEHQIPRILIGLDYYHDLITGHLTKTPSGLHIAKTVFGPAVYGGGFTEAIQAKSVSYNLTAIYEGGVHQKKNPPRLRFHNFFTSVKGRCDECRKEPLCSREKATMSTTVCLQLKPPPSRTPRQAAIHAVQPPFASNPRHPSSPSTSSSCIPPSSTSRSRYSPHKDKEES